MGWTDETDGGGGGVNVDVNIWNVWTKQTNEQPGVIFQLISIQVKIQVWWTQHLSNMRSRYRNLILTSVCIKLQLQPVHLFQKYSTRARGKTLRASLRCVTHTALSRCRLYTHLNSTTQRLKPLLIKHRTAFITRINRVYGKLGAC